MRENQVEFKVLELCRVREKTSLKMTAFTQARAGTRLVCK